MISHGLSVAMYHIDITLETKLIIMVIEHKNHSVINTFRGTRTLTGRDKINDSKTSDNNKLLWRPCTE